MEALAYCMPSAEGLIFSNPEEEEEPRTFLYDRLSFQPCSNVRGHKLRMYKYV